MIRFLFKRSKIYKSKSSINLLRNYCVLLSKKKSALPIGFYYFEEAHEVGFDDEAGVIYRVGLNITENGKFKLIIHGQNTDDCMFVTTFNRTIFTGVACIQNDRVALQYNGTARFSTGELSGVAGQPIARVGFDSNNTHQLEVHNEKRESLILMDSVKLRLLLPRVKRFSFPMTECIMTKREKCKLDVICQRSIRKEGERICYLHGCAGDVGCKDIIE